MSPLRLALLSLLASGCGLASHTAEIQSAPLAPPPEPVTRHFAPVWLEIDPGVVPSQCVAPRGQRRLCFEDVHTAFARSLGQALWTSFPDAPVLGPGDEPRPGDYRLVVELKVDAVPPSEGGPGWAARAVGRFRLLRDGTPLTAAQVESRSRAEFAYGRPLGIGAGEVIDAIALEIANELGRVPETRPELARPLPAVTLSREPSPTEPALPAQAGASPAAAPAPAPSLDASPPPAAETVPSAAAAQVEPYMASASSNVALSSSE